MNSDKMLKLSITSFHVIALLVIISSGILAFQVLGVTGMISGGSGDLDDYSIVGPILNEDGRTTKITVWPTITPSNKFTPTGDPAQDAIQRIVPRGIPFYVIEGDGARIVKGVSFDDPITSQRIWGSLSGNPRFGGGLLELPPDKEQRFKKIESIFTCDYCCGSPSSVTRIANCGCAHSYAWKGMARFFLRFYGDKYSDEQIIGEMTKWKGLWYPQGMIQDYLVYTGKMSASQLRHGGSDGIRTQYASQ
jgi:hypothetical protein